MPQNAAVLTLSVGDFLWFVDQALDQMVAIVSELGDETASLRPDLDGANSPYALLTHCLGVMKYWGGSLVAGRAIERDRDAEFRATGSVAELLDRTVAARRRFDADLATLDPLAAPRNAPNPEDRDLPFGKTQGAVMLHVYEELAQHLGQMEISRDILMARPGTR